MAWGMSDCGFTHNEILKKVLDDIRDAELEYRRCEIDVDAFLVAERIIQRHIDRNYE